ncbi:MAG: hypothetical protein CMJ18_18470 [Phycisphaeraceae bacterium]|nr:hypothetical protein [Phycisphaeraceae bacterium]
MSGMNTPESTEPGNADHAHTIRNGEDWIDVDGHPIEAHDGGVSRFDGIWHWYGTSYVNTPGGEYGAKAARLNPGINVYTSSDLARWKHAGIALAYPESGWGAEGTIGRAHVIFNAGTRQYVMWCFHYATAYPDVMATVSVADAPTGPFRILGPRATGAPPATWRSGGPAGSAQDLNVFRDDDGAAYLVYDDGSRNIRVDHLTDDYLDCTGESVVALEAVHEAPAMIRFRDRYVVAGSGVAGWGPTETHGAVAKSPMGPYGPKHCMTEQKTWGSQITAFFHVSESDNVVCMCDQWWIPDRKNLNRSRYLWLPLHVDPGTDTARLSYRDAWDPFHKAISH